MIKIKGIEIGAGRPKVCVPIVEPVKEDILHQAQLIKDEEAELVEWRADFFDQVRDEKKLLETLEELRQVLEEIPLLFTFRTSKEGGEKSVSWEQYEQILKTAAGSGCVDMVDVEAFRGYDERIHQKKDWKVTDACNRKVLDLMEVLSKQVVLIGSYHNFETTPSKEEILRRLLFIDRMGVDIPKMAVMPQEREDVLRLMEATSLAERLIVEKPLITMSMGVLGAATRISGETFGSAVSFGCLKKESAPGQIEVERLKYILDALHNI